MLLDRVFEDMEPAAQVTEVTTANGERVWYEGTVIPIVSDGRGDVGDHRDQERDCEKSRGAGALQSSESAPNLLLV